MAKNKLKETTAYESSIWHLRKGSKYTKLISLFFSPLIFVSESSIFSKIPLLGELGSLCQKLLLTHKTAWKFEEKNLLGALKDDAKSNQVLNTLPKFSKVVVIGSGPGAVCAARYFSHDDYIVIESGETFSGNYGSHNLSQVIMDFEKAGQEVILSKPLIQFGQGRTLGGGSEVNSGLYHPAPKAIADDWISAIKCSKEEWLSSQLEVEKLLRVNDDIPGSPSDSMIARSAIKLGFDFLKVPRWREYEKNEIKTHFGMRELFWNNRKEKIFCGFEVVRIKTKLEHLEIHIRDHVGNKHTIKCFKIVLSAGTVSTPMILAKSKLIKLSKAKFNLHVMLRSLVEVPITDLGLHDIDPFQSWSRDHKLKFGSAVSSPSLLSPTLGRELKIGENKSLRAFYVSFAPTGKGGFLPIIGLPYFLFNKGDREVFAHAAAELTSTIDADQQVSQITPKDQIAKNASTVHIFGSMPVGGELINEHGELRRDRRIVISDGSLLPSAPLVNPQGPIMTLCNLLAKRRSKNE
jgi:hypothetical protein